MNTTTTKVALKTKASYGLGSFGKDLACAPIYIYLMYYFTDVAGLSAAYVGAVFLVARIIDAVTDPMMGVIVDNTKSRFGKFRPWVLIGTLINAVVLVGLFSTHLFHGTALYVYAAFIYIFWGVTYTIMDIPFWSMVPALSKSREEREHLVVWPRFFASFAWFLTGTWGMQAVGWVGKGNDGLGFQMIAAIIVIFFIASALFTFFGVKEKVAPKKQFEKFGFKDIVQILKVNDQLRVLIYAVLAFQIANLMVSGFSIYYFTYALGDKHLFQIYMMLSGIAEMAGIFCFPWIARILPRRFMWLAACGFPVLSCILLTATNMLLPGNVVMIGAAGVAIKFGVGLANGLSTVMLADVVDYGEFKTGRRTESIIFSVQTMLVKFAGAAGAFIIGVGLSMVGYVANQQQTPETILGIKVLMIVLPSVLMIVSGIVYKHSYRLHDGFNKDEQLAEGVRPADDAEPATSHS